jgi:hypothetical protein
MAKSLYDNYPAIYPILDRGGAWGGLHTAGLLLIIHYLTSVRGALKDILTGDQLGSDECLFYGVRAAAQM